MRATHNEDILVNADGFCALKCCRRLENLVDKWVFFYVFVRFLANQCVVLVMLALIQYSPLPRELIHFIINSAYIHISLWLCVKYFLQHLGKISLKIEYKNKIYFKFGFSFIKSQDDHHNIFILIFGERLSNLYWENGNFHFSWSWSQKIKYFAGTLLNLIQKFLLNALKRWRYDKFISLPGNSNKNISICAEVK